MGKESIRIWRRDATGGCDRCMFITQTKERKKTTTENKRKKRTYEVARWWEKKVKERREEGEGMEREQRCGDNASIQRKGSAEGKGET